MHPSPLIDTFMALRALPEALLRALPPVHQARRLSQCAGVAARRAAWYSALAALTLLTPPESAQTQPDTAPDQADSSQPDLQTLATLLVLAVIGAQIAQRRERHPFTA